jgi:hypothetical protein
MAESTTISRPAPYLEAAGESLLELILGKKLDDGTIVPGLISKEIDTSAFAPQVAGQNVLSQQALQAAATQAGLGKLTFDESGAVTGVGQGTGVAGYQPFLNQAAQYMGPQAYQQFMSPYQQEVIDTTLSEFDVQAAKGVPQLAASAISAGAFGGGREGVQRAVYGSESDRSRALLQAQLQQQGFQQAQQAAAQAQAQAAGLASLQPSLAAANIQALGGAGAADLSYQQSILDAQAQAAQMAAYEPYNRLQFGLAGVGGLLSGQPQAYMTSTSGAGGAGSVGPLSQALSTAAGIYGLGSLFGK